MTPLQYEPAARRDWQPRRALPKRDRGIARILVREQIETDLSVARGQAILPVAHLQKKLGKSTFRLWSVLLTLRNDGGWTHPSLPGLARATKLGEAQVEKSLARLRQFKLLEDYGFHWLRVPCRCDPEVGAHEHKVYLRRVYGLLRADRSNQEFTAVVPSETAQLVKKASGQGGARAGAGRPKSGTNTKASENKPRKSNVGAYKNQEPISQEEPYGSSEKCGVSLRVNSGKTKSQRTLQREREREREALKRFMKYRPPSHQRTGGEPVPNLSQPQAPAATRSALLNADQPAAPAVLALDGVTQHADGSMGLSGHAGRGGYQRKQRFTSDDLRASTELASAIQVPRTPAPPTVSADASEEARLALLRVAYKAAHAKALRQEFWRPARTQSAAERKALLEAAEALLAENLRPHAWALFSFLAWQRMGKKTAPSVKWVWSATRIHEHAQWCHEATGSQDSGKPLPCPSVKELMHRLARIQQRLGWGRPTSEVVCDVLPDTERRVLLAKAAAEREAALVDIERRINAGEWVW